MPKKKIFFVAGNLNSNKSYEYYNFIKPLQKLGNEVVSFDFIEILQDCGREKMNLMLLSEVKKYLPDLVIFVPQTDELIPDLVQKIGKYSKTIGYYYDDMWRIKYSRFWAQYFNYVTTSDVDGVKKFKNAGFNNVIYSPFSCNTEIYSPKNLPMLYDVSFVGGYSPHREWYINYLRKEGVNVKVWGNGWKSKMLSTEKMVNVFNQSRINLNLSNNLCWDISYLFDINRSFRKTLHIWKSSLLAIGKSDVKNIEQVKGRHFEINACGGFQLSYNVNGLEKLYEIDNEIVTFENPKDLLKKIKYYLKHEQKRKSIASSGLNRTTKEHTMKNRFNSILEHIKK